ncbi:MAG: TetR/AcrR family transcriptional regulator [Acidobacteriota bacterium]
MKIKKAARVSKRSATPDPALRGRIVEAARELFFSRGFVRVTADEIAGRLGISKATLYRCFPSKEDILEAVIREHMNNIGGTVEKLLADDSRSVVEKLARLFGHVGSQLSRLGPFLIPEIQKSAPRIWRMIDDFRRDKINRNFKAILESGRGEGLFREDVDPDLLLRMFIRLVQEFINPAEILRSGRSPAAVFESVIKVFFQGILTDKGRLGFTAEPPAVVEPRKECES